MEENNSKKTFWTSLPGILTGVTSLITALVALLTLLNTCNNPPPPPQNTNNIAPINTSITALNTSKEVGDNLWEWTIFIKATPETLSTIEYVEYELHPTFLEPIRKVTTSHNKFALTARGWGTFEIKIQVHFYDGTEKYLTHMLLFKK